jgi:hypothetical protein
MEALILAQKGFSIKWKKKGQVFGSATTSYAAKDNSEARKKFHKDHPDGQIIEIKQTWG